MAVRVRMRPPLGCTVAATTPAIEKRFRKVSYFGPEMKASSQVVATGMAGFVYNAVTPE